MDNQLNRLDAAELANPSQNQFRGPVDQAVCGPEFVAETAWSTSLFKVNQKILDKRYSPSL
jgi:hypothetical protein